ncbi:MAG TPA: aspartate aminotransferase family protein [Syntrophales bacterium]|nr:aspartate aminotransferase family protein [Syntrophales bacterium]HOM07018.1 aspartate aminotransferase family protein [Syntrophales bacterium]HON99583.1 aspartate aminotransferase family protein [Syntrophales bacterium]HPC01075.1 aspartate aminotransferase family protein [Syntrophales bacterium]HPQ06786.1 aspartate aminotransferase family protein [Syntrophales bacterium]
MSGGDTQGRVFYRNLRKVYPVAARGEGIYIYDTEGKAYIDGSGGAAVASIGHGVKEIASAMAAQLDLLAFCHGSQFTSRAAVDLAEKLLAMSPPGMNRVYFLSGGSEAVETAVKMARQYQSDRGKPTKYKVISRWTSFHGNTLGALALGGHTGRRRYYLPLIPHTPHIVPAYCYRCPYGRTPETCRLECADALEEAILYEGPDSVSAFLAEPVVGATAGCLVPKDGYFQRIREICDRYDCLLIADEVMTGIGRTGRNFALDHWGVRPDMIVCAKGLGAGYYPINAVVTTEEIHRVIKEGNGIFVHGHTYSQNPLGCAAALAVLAYIERHDLVRRSAEMGAYLLEGLRRLEEIPIVGDVRGLGLFAGVEFVVDKEKKTPFDPSLKVNTVIANKAFAKGLIVYPGGGGADGIRGDHVLIAPPFTIEEGQIDTLVEILGEAVLETERDLRR